MVGVLFPLSCSKEEASHEETISNPSGAVSGRKCHLSVSASKSGDNALTKALSLDGKTLSATWKKGETVDVVFFLTDEGEDWMVGEMGSITVMEDGEKASLQGELDLNDSMLYYLEEYPDACYLFLSYPGYPLDWSGQDGTLETLSQKYDYAYTRCKIVGLEGDNLLLENPEYQFINNQVIVKFSFVDRAQHPVNVSQIQLNAYHFCESINDHYEYFHTLDDYHLDNDGNYVGGDWYHSGIGYHWEFMNYLNPDTESWESRTWYGWYTGAHFPIILPASTNELYVAFGLFIPELSCFIIDGILEGGEPFEYTKNPNSPRENPIHLKVGRYYNIEVSLPYLNVSNLESDYVAQDGDILTGTVKNHSITIPDGASVTLRDVIIEAPDGKPAIICEGDATLNIESSDIPECVLVGGKDCAGIATSETDTNLSITGNGGLFVRGGENAAGIGAGKDQSIGDLTFRSSNGEGGNLAVTISGGENGAGIGGGLVMADGISMGYIRVYPESSGSVIEGGDNAAGIGSGYASGQYQVEAEGVWLEVGKGIDYVSVWGGINGAGIGSGRTNAIGNLAVIAESLLFVRGGCYAAGIGCGRGNDSDEQLPSTCGHIGVACFENGIIQAESAGAVEYADSEGYHYAAGGSPAIGAGLNGSSCQSINVIIPESSSFSGRGSGAAFIGTSFSVNPDYMSSCGSIELVINGPCFPDNGSLLTFDRIAFPWATENELLTDMSDDTQYHSIKEVSLEYHIGPTIFADPVPEMFFPGVMTGSITISGEFSTYYKTDDGVGYYFVD